MICFMYTIGQSIEITTKFPSHYIYRKEDFNLTTHHGVVVANPKWLENPSKHVTIKTNDGMTRIIALERVVGYQSDEQPTTLRTFSVKSKSKQSEYIVTVDNGKASCDCTGFQFRRYCKHSTAVLNLIAREQNTHTV